MFLNIATTVKVPTENSTTTPSVKVPTKPTTPPAKFLDKNRDVGFVLATGSSGECYMGETYIIDNCHNWDIYWKFTIATNKLSTGCVPCHCKIVCIVIVVCRWQHWRSKRANHKKQRNIAIKTKMEKKHGLQQPFRLNK